MFEQSPNERLSSWKQFRETLELSSDPFLDVIQFWHNCPYIPFNNKVDPYNPKSWPTPWDILVENKYDDFTKALMIGWTLKYTSRFENSDIQVRTLVDNSQKLVYNVVCVDDKWILNYDDNQPVGAASVPDSFRLENLTVIERPR